jgi:predicted nucleotidyltransferase
MKFEELDLNFLKIVPSIKKYLEELEDCPFKESSESRAAKFVMYKWDPYLFIRDSFTRDEYIDVLVVIAAKNFPSDDLELLNDPQNFLVHLLLHEIRHYKGLEIQELMDINEKERDSDSWAFTRLKLHNKLLQATGTSRDTRYQR